MSIHPPSPPPLAPSPSLHHHRQNVAPKRAKKPHHIAELVATETEKSTTSPTTDSRGRRQAESQSQPQSNSRWRRRWRAVYEGLGYIPPRCRYDPDKPFKFSMGLNVLFAFAGAFTVANLYYTHPILNKLAHDFDVTDEQSSYIPTLAQAGYAAGLLLLCPLGDLVKRRAFVLWLVWFTATVWTGLCITRSFAVFVALSFVTGVTTVTPQLMLPLVGDLAPPHRRPTALSIVVSGMLFGMLIARVLSGVVTEFIGWRSIYWIAFALQYLILILLWFFMPDYPSTNNPDKSILHTYPSLLLDIVKLAFQHPVLVQGCLIGFFTSATFTSFWTTLTFLLAGEPYNYTPLVIGLFALIGIASIAICPVFARTVMENHVPLFSILAGELTCLTGIVVGTYTGLHTVAGPVLQAIGIDVGLQVSQIGNRTAIYGVAPLARNRVNTAYMVSVFCGQLMGTAAGNHLYARGGWVLSGSASVGFICSGLFFCLLRGPHEKGWIGWGGGIDMRIDRKGNGDGDGKAVVKDEEKRDDDDEEKGPMAEPVPAATGGSSESERYSNSGRKTESEEELKNLEIGRYYQDRS